MTVFTAIVVSAMVYASQPQSGQPELTPAAAMQLFTQAYQLRPSVEIRFKQASTVSGDNLATTLRRFDETPGLTKTVYPGLKGEFYDLMRGKVLLAPNGSVRVETERIAIGRGWPAAFTPQFFKLWSPTESATFTLGGEEEAEVRDISLVDRDRRIALRKSGQINTDFLKALDSFPGMIEWVRALSNAAQDLKIVEAQRDGEIALASNEMGLRFAIDRATGAIRSVEYRGPHGQVWESRYEGELADPLFPAKYPKLEIRYFGRDHGPRTPGDIITYESTSRVKPPDESAFQWASVAPFAFKVADKVVVDRKGVVDQKRTQYRLERQPPILKASPPPPALEKRTSSLGRPWYIVGIVAFVATVGVFIRSRMN